MLKECPQPAWLDYMWCINSRHLPKFLMNMSGLGRNANIFKYSKVESGNWIKFQFEREWIWVGEKQSQKIVTSAFCLFLSCWPRSLVSLYLCPPQCLGLSYLYCLVCHQTLHHRPLVFSPFPRNIANKLPKNAEGNWLKKSQTLPNFSHTSTRPQPTQYWPRQLRRKKTEWSSEVLRASPSSTLCASTQAQGWKVPNLAAKPHLCRSQTPPPLSSYWLTGPLLTSKIFWREMEEKLFI